jgi:hypothetical protein
VRSPARGSPAWWTTTAATDECLCGHRVRGHPLQGRSHQRPGRRADGQADGGGPLIAAWRAGIPQRAPSGSVPGRIRCAVGSSRCVSAGAGGGRGRGASIDTQGFRLGGGMEGAGRCRRSHR